MYGILQHTHSPYAQTEREVDETTNLTSTVNQNDKNTTTIQYIARNVKIEWCCRCAVLPVAKIIEFENK